ncbi:hypothetical protein DVS77_21090 [Mycolicibacterium moriokaense]|nr:hypothetical protein DVS77_21090 [Mycolicibacterium moriokaense]
MKLMAALVLACGVTAAPLMVAGQASALPGTCDGVDCVPYVDRGIAPTDTCQFKSRYPFGLDPAGNTFVCNASNEWVAVAPLIGVRTLRAPCDDKVPGTAQSPLGQLMDCEAQAWTAYNDVFYYG